MSGGGRTLTYTIHNISTHLHVNSRRIKWCGVARTHISEGVVYIFFVAEGEGLGEGRFPGTYFIPGLELRLNFSSQKQSKLV